MDQSKIRNFCIIAHIDHGKSTLSDRLLELTGTIEKRRMQAQMLDTMDLERERGITIKLQPARMSFKAKDGEEYQLNLIDTPGHVDFNYEVSRSLAAVEGAVLLVDATQGVQAQTIANLYLALDQDLAIIPVLNKIDLPNAEPERRAEELMKLIGCKREEILSVSGKTGENVHLLLERIVNEVPPPSGDPAKPFRALIFDSKYDDYKGVVAYVRVIDGELKQTEKVKFLATGASGETLEAGYLKPDYVNTRRIAAGEIGYIVSGLKEIQAVRVGDTVGRLETAEETEVLPGYKEVHPMVYASIFPKEGNEYQRLREAMEKLKLSDAALQFEPEHSAALGFGFRCGLLGMLHLEIVQERLRREHAMELVITTPSVAYEITRTDGTNETITSPLDYPEANYLEETREPWVAVDIVSPADYIGGIMTLISDRRGLYKATDYLDPKRVVMHYDMPLASVIVDFHDKLKSVTSGYGSLSYEFKDYRKSDIVLLDISVAEKRVPAFSTLLHESEAYRRGREIVGMLKDTLPRAQFVIKIQASIGAKIIASERISAFRKDVTGYLYGGDVTRKMKLLQKQKKGKQRMMSMGAGSVEIPPDTFIKVLRRGERE
ncbi:elongation factor 4 [Candidatus Uhrbacteria bacterium]|nr:elongation factor 4 [Candidatus Uhrbacteria bacterium]